MAAPKGQGTGEHSGDSLGCGAGRFGVRAAGSSAAGGYWCVWSCTCTPAHVCSGMHGIVLSLEFALGWEGLGILSQGEPLGWFLGLSRQAVPVLGARPASSCPNASRSPLLPATGTALGCATKLHPLPASIPLGGQCSLHSHLLSLLTQCFELYILQKQPQPIACTGEGLGALSWGTDFPGSSAEDSRCLWKKKKVLLFILRLLTAILCNICCFLFQGGVCELYWEMMISGVDGV